MFVHDRRAGARRRFIPIVLACLAASTVALAETPEESAFGFGQFIGAARFCKLPTDRVDDLATNLLASAGIDPKAPGTAMVRFDEGVSNGTRLMSLPGATSCEAVTAAFEEAYKKAKE
jgi:hypothetical protein